MKKSILLIIIILGLTTTNSCKKNKNEEVIPNKDVRVQNSNVSTYEIVNLISHETLKNKYDATFGSIKIELQKTSDTTLTFFVPEISQSDAVLKFELAHIKFNVTQTSKVEVNKLISDITQTVETQIGLLKTTTAVEIAEVNEINDYKKEVLKLFNSLTNEQKIQTAYFYEANKDVVKSFTDNVFKDFNAPTVQTSSTQDIAVLQKQSECPRTDFKSFYGCTATNLGDAAYELKDASKGVLEMLGYAATIGGYSLYGIAGPLSPVALGITAVGISLPLGMAGYLLLTEVRPAFIHFKRALFPFIGANWIFTKTLFRATVEVFQDQIGTNLNLLPSFRSMNSTDGNVNSGSGYFISAMTSLSETWNNLTSIFGSYPTYRNTEIATILTTNEVSISNISNPNVQYQGNTGQSLKFKTLSGKEESFTYTVKVTKQGFIEEKILNGKVLSTNPCNDGSTTPPVITNFELQCTPTEGIKWLISFTSNGTGALIGSGSGVCNPSDNCYPTRLYFIASGMADYGIGANGYDVKLVSGNSNAGVIEIRLRGSFCLPGKTAAETLATYKVKYKVEIMNKCYQRSNQVNLN